MIEAMGDDPSLIRDLAYQRAVNLWWLAEAAARAGDRDRTRATVARFLESAAKIKDEDNRHSLFQVAAPSQAKAGDPEGALTIVAGLRDGRVHAGLCPGRDRGSAGHGGGSPRRPRNDGPREAEAEGAEKEPPSRLSGPLGAGSHASGPGPRAGAARRGRGEGRGTRRGPRHDPTGASHRRPDCRGIPGRAAGTNRHGPEERRRPGGRPGDARLGVENRRGAEGP